MLRSKALLHRVCGRGAEVPHSPPPSSSNASIHPLLRLCKICSQAPVAAAGAFLVQDKWRSTQLSQMLEPIFSKLLSFIIFLPISALFLFVNSNFWYSLGHLRKELCLIMVSGNGVSSALISSLVWSHLLSVFLEFLFLVCWWHLFCFQHHYCIFFSAHIFYYFTGKNFFEEGESDMFSQSV